MVVQVELKRQTASMVESGSPIERHKASFEMDSKLTCIVAISLFLLVGCIPNRGAARGIAAGRDYSRDTIQTLLPFDAIPAITNPRFVTASEADLGDDAPVIGVNFNGEQHAYSIYLLNGHEIVNDVVGGIKIATTW